MKNDFNFLGFIIIFCFSTFVNAQYIQVVDNVSPQDLVQNTLINSPCANVSGFQIRSGNFSGAENSYGYFTAGSSGFPFSDGIILSTGKSTSAIGPNSGILSEGFTSWMGDSDLDIALGISSSINATVLEFNFVPLTSKISFDYIFSSEQYLSNPSSRQCAYTDGFAFLLKEDIATSYQNLAIIPNTTIPVSVNTVRGIGTICPDANAQFFDAFNGVNHPTNFNGQTIPLQAKAIVIPGKTYNIKLVIADQGNNLYDSAIFLKGGSFNIGVDLGTDKVVLNNNPICSGEIEILDARQPGTNTYKWFANGTQITNEFGSTYQITDNTNTNEVEYSVEVTLGSSGCEVNGQIKIQFADKPILQNAILTACDLDLDGKTTFNLSSVDNFIRNNNSSLGSVIYFENLNNAQNNLEPISNPNNYINKTTNNLVAKVTNTFGCSSYADVLLQINNNKTAQTLSFCDTDTTQDGRTSIDLNLKITPNLVPAIESNETINYYLNENDAILEQNQISNNFSNTIANQQIIFGRISNGFNCGGIIKLTLNIDSFSGDNFRTETKYLCPLKSVKLQAPLGYSYVWSNGNLIDNFINVTTTGNFSVQVSKTNTCSLTKNFVVLPSESAIINSIDVNDFNENNNTILVNYSGVGNYQFSLDGINFQSSNLFENVAIGEYFVTIIDLNTCNPTVSDKVFVLDFPKYFTPNNDGYNDVWKIENINPNTIINIYDRFGKFLFQINKNSVFWDGNYQGKQLVADDYWFTLELENNRIIKSHFALKR